MDRAALRQVTDPADRRGYILARLESGKQNRLGTEHFSGNDGAFDRTVIGHGKVFRTDPNPAVGAGRNSRSVCSRIDSRPLSIDGKSGCFSVATLNLPF